MYEIFSKIVPENWSSFKIWQIFCVFYVEAFMPLYLYKYEYVIYSLMNV